MSTSFQPDRPHEPATGNTSGRSIVVFSIIAALAMLLILATFMPRISDNQTLNWVVTLGGAVLVIVIGVAWGASKRTGESSTR
jgi:chromate transport protein ChrA